MGAGETRERRPWLWEVILVVSFLLIGGALRFYRLEELPPRISADEYSTTSEVFEILHGVGPPVFGLDWKPMPALTEHVTAILMRLVGPSILGIRLLSILLSLLAGVLLFYILRWSCSVAVAWATAVVLLSNPWFLNFSRSGWENMHVGTYWLLFTWCFFSGLRAGGRTWIYYLGAAAALALSLYGYFSGRLILASWLLYFPFAARASGQSWGRVLTAYAITSVVAVSLFAPQLPAVIQHWDALERRVRAVSIFSVEPTAHGYSSRASLVAHQLGRAGRYLLIGSPIGGVHYSPTSRPPFHLALIPLMLIGMARALVRWRVGLWWWLLVLVPVVATQGFSWASNPNLARMAGACPGFFWFVGYGAGAIADLARGRIRHAVAIVLAGGALLISVQEWWFFESWMQSEGVRNARGGGVDCRNYRRWQEIQFERIAGGKRFVHVLEWERPEVRAALLGDRANGPDALGKP